MSNHTTLSVRLAAAAATTAATLLITVAPALAQTAPEPNFAGPRHVSRRAPAVRGGSGRVLDRSPPARRRRPRGLGRRCRRGRRGTRSARRPREHATA